MDLINDGSKRIGSRSDVQAEVESYVLDALASTFGIKLTGGRMKTGNSFVQIDGLSIDRERSFAVAVEVFAHIGRVKAAQRHKVHADVFKLALVQTLLRKEGIAEVKAIFAFTCPECARSVSGRTWIADAAERFEVQSMNIELPADLRAKVLEAQARQNLIEPKVEDSGGEQ